MTKPMINEIGSNFCKYDLNAPVREEKLWWEDDKYNKVFFKSGRNALKAIARKLKGEGHKPSVLLPIYTCETVITPFLDEGWEVDYYNINADLSVNFLSVIDKITKNAPSAILFHSYFGLDTLSGDIEEIKKLHDGGIIIIEDMTQSLFSQHCIEFADYYVTSLRKFLAIPDGGCVFSQKPLCFSDIGSCDERIAPKAIEAFDLKNEYFDAPTAEKKQLFRESYGELNGFISDNAEIRDISPASKQMFLTSDVNEIKDKRRSNYAFLLDGIKKYGFISPAAGVSLSCGVPLYLPIYVDGDRASLQRHLAENDIFCPVIWPKPSQIELTDDVSAYMYRQMLCFPIDQRYDLEDMRRILSVLDEYKN